MENNEQNNQVTPPATDVQEYIDTINELRNKTVSKDEYEAVKANNTKLLNALKNGETIKEEVKPVDINELRKDLFTKQNNNLDYITKTLQLREELIKQGESDPFLPIGTNVSPSDEDIATANKVADVFQQCVEYADGDSNIFTTELQRSTTDTAPIRRRRK